MTDQANGSCCKSIHEDSDVTIVDPMSPIVATCQSPIVIPGDGSCFFKSLEYIMGAEVWASFSLRFLVARSVLEKDPIMDSQTTLTTVDLWKNQAEADPSGVEATLMDKVVGSDGLLNRYQLFENMLDPRKYWGDQYAILVLESILLVRILVILSKEKASTAVHDVQWYMDRDIDLFVVLNLDREHYEPLPDCTTLLHRHELPDLVQTLWKEDRHVFL